MPEISLLIRYWSFITFSFFIWNFEHSYIATIWNIFSNITKSHSLNICISFWARIKSGNSGHILKSHGNYKKPVNFFCVLSFWGGNWQSLKILNILHLPKRIFQNGVFLRKDLLDATTFLEVSWKFLAAKVLFSVLRCCSHTLHCSAHWLYNRLTF